MHEMIHMLLGLHIMFKFWPSTDFFSSPKRLKLLEVKFGLHRV